MYILDNPMNPSCCQLLCWLASILADVASAAAQTSISQARATTSVGGMASRQAFAPASLL